MDEETEVIIHVESDNRYVRVFDNRPSQKDVKGGDGYYHVLNSFQFRAFPLWSCHMEGIAVKIIDSLVTAMLFPCHMSDV